MKKNIHYSWLIILLILLAGRNTSAQPSDADKLRLQIAKEANDTLKIKMLIDFSLNYAKDDKESDSCLKEAYMLSRVKKYKYGLAWGKYYEGRQLSAIGKYDEAIEKYNQSIEELNSMHVIQYSQGYPLSEIRVIYNLAGKQEEKFRYYTEKLAFYKKYGPIENMANCFHGIAGYYYHIADYNKAIEYYLRARELYKSFDHFGYVNEKQVVGSVYLEWGNLGKAEIYLKSYLKDLINPFYCYTQLGNISFKRKEYKQALNFYKEGEKYYAEPEFPAINLVNYAKVHLQLGSMDSARYYLDSAEKIRKSGNFGINFPAGNLEIDYYFYKYFVETGNNKLALKHLVAALNDAQSSIDIPLVSKYTNELHSFLLKQGDSLQALRYLIQYQSLQDSLNAMSTRARIASFEIEQQQRQKENEIAQLQVQKTNQRNYYLIGGVILVLIVLGILSRLRYKRKMDKELLTTNFKKQLAQSETKALRAQMNPHFIFNSLNSINSFIIDQKHEIASDYLVKFSKLIRLILDNSRSETISIEKELETLELYVILESARFDNKFECIYNIAEDVNTGSIMIPPMLLQPFVENAIWHGLMQKEGEGTITIEIKKQDEDFLNISITDDGIGREKAAELKSKSATYKSHGLKVTSQRIEMMNKLNSSGAKVLIIDLQDEFGNATGTKVELIIPF